MTEEADSACQWWGGGGGGGGDDAEGVAAEIKTVVSGDEALLRFTFRDSFL